MLVTVPVVSRLIGSQVSRALALTLTLALALLQQLLLEPAQLGAHRLLLLAEGRRLGLQREPG